MVDIRLGDTIVELTLGENTAEATRQAGIATAQALEVGRLVAAIGDIGDDAYAYRSKALAVAALGGVPDGKFVRVLSDETKNGSLALYQKRGAALEYVTSLSGTSDQRPIPTGVLFDTDAADDFTGMAYTADASLTVAAGSVAFSSASVKSLPFKPKDPAGNLLRIASDYVTVDATVTLTSYPAASDPGLFVGMLNDALGDYGVQMRAHGAGPTLTLPGLVNATAGVGNLSSGEALPTTVRVQYIRAGDQVSGLLTFDGDPVRTIGPVTQVYDATSLELPRLFHVPMLRFENGVSSASKLKVSQSFPGAKFAFVGDSHTQGRYVATYADGFPQRVRATYPGQVFVSAAPSATTGNWLIATHHVTEMRPRYVFQLLGTNDLIGGIADATIKANITALMNTWIGADIVPIILTVPPRGSFDVPALNTWIKAQGWRYIDIYPLLVGSGNSLNAAYDSGDTIHMNSAGHAVIADAVKAYITGEGL